LLQLNRLERLHNRRKKCDKIVREDSSATTALVAATTHGRDLGTHSRAIFCASAIRSGVILAAIHQGP
jgi:hypothetical protein